jgi:transcription initiation factor IIE alpha subunit
MPLPGSSILQCPSCAKVITFSSQHTNLFVCSTCGSSLVKLTDGTLTSKPVYVISKKNDFIQPGTTGTWKGKSFTVLGRFRAWFDESVFNYWTIEWDSSKEIAFLGEAYGLFSILTVATDWQENNYSSSRLEKLKTGGLQKVKKDQEFILEKKQKTIRCEIEGELLFPEIPSLFTVYDFSSVGKSKITLFDFQKDNILAYDVQYVTLASLQFKNTRYSVREEKEFICTKCSNRIVIKVFPYSQSCSCKNCGSYYSLDNATDYKYVSKAKTSEIPDIELGATGVIEEVQYEVIGYTQKEEQNSYYSKWREFTLYNPQEGFAFLSEYDGHWIFLKETCNSPMLSNDNQKDLFFSGKEFQVFNTYTYEVVNARGEFPYNIFDNQKAKCREFIAPPFIWIQEKDSKEGIRWFTGRHISHREVAKTFNTTVRYRVGIGAVQPGSVSKMSFYKAIAVGFLLLLLTHFFTTNGKLEKVLLSNTYSFSDTSNTISFVTDKYELNKNSSNLRLAISAPVSNNWFELSATLVNAKTGKEYSLEKGVEYYYGYTDGESWKEGSQQEDAYFTRIPKGTYFLQIQGLRDSEGYVISNFSLEITYDVTNMRNFWISIILFLLWPVGKYLHMRYVEAERWRNSPFSNYNDES